MSVSVSVNKPKTPVTEGSGDRAPATLPNVCKMPGPPAPFVPTPLPNIGGSSDRLGDGTTSVKIEGRKIAIKGSYYMSMPSGDLASQGTGGGVLSGCVQGKTEFTAPGSMNVKAEGKNIQLLGDAMTNNGSSKNTGATLPGNIQQSLIDALGDADAKKLCKAICKAKNNSKVTRKQDAVAKSMSSKAYPRYQPKPGSTMLPEVSYKIPSVGGRALSLIRSGSRVLANGQKAAGSVFRGLMEAARLGKGNVVRWDFVQVIDAAKAPTPGNVRKYVEVKFPPDELTDNQEKAMRKMKDPDKVVVVTPEDCGC